MLADAHILSLGLCGSGQTVLNGQKLARIRLCLHGTCGIVQVFVRQTALQSVTMVCTTSDKQISRTFQGFFKDKLQELFNKSAFMHKNVFTLPVSFTGSFSPRMS